MSDYRWGKVTGWPKWFAKRDGKHVLSIVYAEGNWKVWLADSQGRMRELMNDLSAYGPKDAKRVKTLAAAAHCELLRRTA